MTSQYILRRIIDASNHLELNYHFTNKGLDLLSRIPSFEANLVFDEFNKITSYNEKEIKEKHIYLWELYVSYLSDILQYEAVVIDSLKSSLFDSANPLYQDKEFICEILIDFEEHSVITDFIKLYPNYENHYLIEKILEALSNSQFDIGDLIVKYLDDDYHSGVRTYALEYIKVKKLCAYENEIMKLIGTEEQIHIVHRAVKILKNCNRYEVNRNVIDKRIEYLNEKFSVPNIKSVNEQSVNELVSRLKIKYNK